MKNKQMAMFTIMIIVVLVSILTLLYRDRSNETDPNIVGGPPVGNGEGVGQQNEPVSPSPTPTPAPQEAQPTSGGMTLLMRVIWDSDGEPVPGALLSLSLSRTKPFSLQDAHRMEEVSDKDGMATFHVPMEESVAKKCASELTVTHPDGKPYRGNRPYVGYRLRYSDSIYPIRMKKDCGIAGTVYWKPDGTNYVPASGATVVAVDAVVTSEQMDMAHLGRKNDFSITTDADGKYRFRGLTLSPQQLWAYLDEYTLLKRPNPVMPEVGEPTKPWDIYLERGVTITAMVNDKSTYAPISNATVTARYGEGVFSQLSTTDSDGFCQLKGIPIGAVMLEAGAEGYARETSEIKTSLTNESHIPFFLGAGGTIRVFATKGGRPLPDLNIDLYASARLFWISETTGDDGSALIEGVPCKSEITVSARDKALKGSVRCVAYSDKITTVALRTYEDPFSQDKSYGQQHFTFEGIVVDTEGVPVPSATMSTMGCCKRKALTDAEGYFSLSQVHSRIYPCSQGATEIGGLVDPIHIRQHYPNIRKDYGPLFVKRKSFEENADPATPFFVGPARLSVEADGYAPLAGVYVSVCKDNKITLEASATLTIRVLDRETRKPITDYLTKQSGGGKIRVVSKDGCYSFSNIKPNSYLSIAVFALGYITQFPDGKPSEKTMDILLERQAFYNAIVVDGITQEPVSGMKVRQVDFEVPETWADYERLYKNRSYSAEYVTDADGAFTFNNVNVVKSLLFIPPNREIFSIRIDDLLKRLDPQTKLITIFLTDSNASVSARYAIGPDAFDKGSADLTLTCVEPVTRGKSRNIEAPSFYGDGVWRWDNLYPGEYRLVGGRKGAGGQDTMRFHIQHAEKKYVTLGEKNTSSVSGHFYRKDGTPYSSARIAFYSIADSHWDKNIFIATSDIDGNYSAQLISPGEYIVYLQVGPDLKLLKRKGSPVRIIGASIQDLKSEDFEGE